MTISSPVTSVEYVASGGQTNFVGTWRITESNQVAVYKNGVLQVTGYSVTGVGDPNFTVVFSVGLIAGDVVELVLDPLFDQQIDYRFNDKFPEESTETGLDKLTLICLSLLHKVKRAVRFSDTSDPIAFTFPSLVGNALKFLRVKADASGVEWQNVAASGSVPSDAVPQDTTSDAGTPGTVVEYSRGDHIHHSDGGIAQEVIDEIDARLDSLEGAGSSAVSGTFLVNGGQVVWTSGLSFLVAAATYYINGVLYTSAQQTVALDAADGTNPRIDSITLNTSGVVGKVTGTPNANPSEPTVDPLTLLKLTIVLVPAGSSTPAGTSNTPIYLENAGDPGEWNWTTSGSGINVDSTSSPRTGTKVIEATNMPVASFATGQKGSGSIDINTFDRLVLYVRSKGFGNARFINVFWLDGGTQKGNKVLIRNNQWGFNSQNTTDYQVIAIDTIQFAIPSGVTVNQLRFQPGGASIGFRIDDVQLQKGAGTVVQPPAVTPSRGYYKYLAAALEPMAVEGFQTGTFNYVIASNEKKIILNSWQAQIGGTGRFEHRKHEHNRPLVVSGKTIVGTGTGADNVTSSLAVINPALAVYSDAEATYYERLLALTEKVAKYFPLTTADTKQLFLPGPYGSMLLHFVNFDYVWVVFGNNLANVNFMDEIGDVGANDYQRLADSIFFPLSKNFVNNIKPGPERSAGLGRGGILYVDLDASWSKVPDSNVYIFRDDLLGASLDTATKWTRAQSVAGNVEIDTSFPWLKVKGNDAWGNNGCFSQTTTARANGKRFQCDVWVQNFDSGALKHNMIVGWHDGAGHSFSDFSHGVDFTTSGGVRRLQVFENGNDRGVVGANPGYTEGHTYRVRITLNGNAAVYEIQGGPEYQKLGGTSWTDITPGTTSSSTTPLAVGVARETNGTGTNYEYVGDIKMIG